MIPLVPREDFSLGLFYKLVSVSWRISNSVNLTACLMILSWFLPLILDTFELPLLSNIMHMFKAVYKCVHENI